MDARKAVLRDLMGLAADLEEQLDTLVDDLLDDDAVAQWHRLQYIELPSEFDNPSLYTLRMAFLRHHGLLEQSEDPSVTLYQQIFS